MSPARTGRLGGAVAAVATLLLAWSLGGPASPAHATGTPAAGKATLTAEKTTGLDPAGDVVKLVGKGFTPGVRLFILPCDPAQGAGRACDMGSFSGPTEADATGSFGTDVKVAAKFGAVDCLKTRCAIATSNSANGKDRTQEVYLPIGFRGEDPGLPASPPPATAAPQAGAPGAGAPKTSAAPPAAAPSTAPTKSAAEDEDDGKGGLIIGLIAAVVVVLVVVGVVVKRRRPSA
ncbi:neocarzinostatin apoprotein domain-containing protein [Embleya scabrispora]|uniref:neocarzinostatin apoprotein domain-containing protein n=1 Tax=Embleya scabrispora TaxID=159449 RepID=UPI0003A484D0|nr:neocarzinostatin apoprotein domain-containing protein [Embleya scabrispora]MYS84264.1 hypothetical protein [Streptomyces sp. SID5474]